MSCNNSNLRVSKCCSARCALSPHSNSTMEQNSKCCSARRAVSPHSNSMKSMISAGQNSKCCSARRALSPHSNSTMEPSISAGQNSKCCSTRRALSPNSISMRSTISAGKNSIISGNCCNYSKSTQQMIRSPRAGPCNSSNQVESTMFENSRRNVSGQQYAVACPPSTQKVRVVYKTTVFTECGEYVYQG
ncbi:unnamed protein product [Brassicogethes aeneus]|uniref:Uncharacterized protein n=1 Tax=Brassicogethes aeneus TaxID=1431903 RepID=A0A9P0FF81_BRAAE|nr:unnamed protein product [Brassicogethes aeneus]